MKCKECGAQMKPLFASTFCPNDCDVPEVLAKRRAAEKAEAQAKAKAAYDEAAKRLAAGQVDYAHLFGAGIGGLAGTGKYFPVPSAPAKPGVVNWATIKKDTKSSPGFYYVPFNEGAGFVHIEKGFTWSTV